VLTHGVQGLAGRRDQTEHVQGPRLLGIGRERRAGPMGGGDEGLGVGEPPALRAEGGVLPRLGRDGRHLLDAEAQQVGLPGPFARGLRQRGALGLGGTQLGPRRAVGLGRSQRDRPAEPVEQVALAGRRGQPHLVVLAVDGDEPVGDLGHHSRGHGPAADEGAAAALGRHGAGHEQGPLVELGAGLARPRRRRGVLAHQPSAVDLGACRAAAHGTGVGLRTEQQPQPGEHHRLARPGLAGDDREPRVQRQRGLVDDPEATQPHLLDHPRPPRQPPTGSANFATSRSVKGLWCRRASRTGVGDLVTSTRDPTGRSTRRRPSHHSTPSGPSSTSTASRPCGDSTSGRAKSAWALMGTTTSASTLGQTTGPPALNA
jgi:hypothetical protein